jgi:hypothetical protein
MVEFVAICWHNLSSNGTKRPGTVVRPQIERVEQSDEGQKVPIAFCLAFQPGLVPANVCANPDATKIPRKGAASHVRTVYHRVAW